MKKKLGIILYLLLAVVIGVGCSRVYWYILGCKFFNALFWGLGGLPGVEESFIFIKIVTIVGVIIFLYVGKRFIKNNGIVVLAFVLILSIGYIYPKTEIVMKNLKNEIMENNHKEYAASHESEMVNEVNQALIELNLPFTLDLKNSHYDTLYYNRRFSDNYLRLYFEKIKEGNLTDEEVWQLLSILPEKQRDYWISITYEEGKNTFFFHNCLYARSFEENVGNDESEMVNQVNQVITESNLPFAVNLKTSHYDTLRHNDMLRVQVEKTNEKGLTIEEIEQLVKMLPEQQNAYRMEIVYGKSTYEKRIGSVFRSKEKSITIFLDENKKVTECSGQDQELCEAIELLVGCSS